MDHATILVVDDDREIANAIEKLLTFEGYKVIKHTMDWRLWML